MPLDLGRNPKRNGLPYQSSSRGAGKPGARGYLRDGTWGGSPFSESSQGRREHVGMQIKARRPRFSPAGLTKRENLNMATYLEKSAADTVLGLTPLLWEATPQTKVKRALPGPQKTHFGMCPVEMRWHRGTEGHCRLLPGMAHRGHQQQKQ